MRKSHSNSIEFYFTQISTFWLSIFIFTSREKPGAPTGRPQVLGVIIQRLPHKG